MKIGNIEFGPQPLFLAPMEDVTDIGFMSWEILYKYDEEYHTDETRWGGKLLNKCHFVYAYYMTERL